MRNNKAQIAIFMLIGVILFIAISFFLFIKSDGNPEIEKVSRVPFSINPIKTYVESCIKNVGIEGISLIGRRGGYVNLPAFSTKDYITKTAYYFYVDRDIMPSKERVEQELSLYMDEELFFCIRNFADFRDQGFNIEQGDIKTETIIGLNDVLFKVNFPVSIKRGDSETRLSSFSNLVDNVRLGVIYDASREIINEQMKDFNSICLSCLVDLGIENDLYVDMNRFGNSSVLFTITDFNSKIDNLPYKYTFANKYEEISCTNIPADWSEDRINEFLLDCVRQQIDEFNYTLRIIEIPELNVVVNELFFYDVNVTGFNVTFSDFTNLFEIDETTGMIEFTPGEEDVGEHIIWINVVDSLGNEDFESFKLNIIKKS